MPARTNHDVIYTMSAGGILTPTGSVSDFANSSATSFVEVARRANELRQMFLENGLELSAQCDLVKHIEHAVRLADSQQRRDAKMSFADLFGAMQAERIAQAVLPLKSRAGCARYLHRLRRGNMNLLMRTPSEAKAILWELELWSTFRRLAMDASLAEPDVVVRFGRTRVGIACKKIFSEENVAKTLSTAVAQIERNNDVGGIALNLDDLAPPDSIYAAATGDRIAQGLRAFINEFIARHETPLRRYLASGRAVFALVSIGMIGHSKNEHPAFNNFRQTVVWNIPGLSADKAAQVQNIKDAFEWAHQ